MYVEHRCTRTHTSCVRDPLEQLSVYEGVGPPRGRVLTGQGPVCHRASPDLPVRLASEQPGLTFLSLHWVTTA